MAKRLNKEMLAKIAELKSGAAGSPNSNHNGEPPSQSGGSVGRGTSQVRKNTAARRASAS